MWSLKYNVIKEKTHHKFDKKSDDDPLLLFKIF